MLREYIINDEKLLVQIVIRKTNKNICLRIKNNRLYLSMPYKVSDKEITALISKNYEKIKERMIPSNKLHYLGSVFDYEILKSNVNKVDFDEKIKVYTKNLDSDYLKKIIKKAYVVKAEELLSGYILEAKESFKEDIKSELTIKFSYTTTSYGKCYPKRNIICFSGLCAKLEPELMKLVVYHEFCHLTHLGHNKAFYSYLESKLPNAVALSKKLRKYRPCDFFD